MPRKKLKKTSVSKKITAKLAALHDMTVLGISGWYILQHEKTLIEFTENSFEIDYGIN